MKIIRFLNPLFAKTALAVKAALVVKASLTVALFCVSGGLYVHAQQHPRLMELPGNQVAWQGQSLYAFTVKMNKDRSVILSIDDVQIGHFFNGESAEIAVDDGRHVVKAHQMKWDEKAGGWREDDDDRLTDTLNSVRFPVTVNPGPKLRGGRTTAVTVGVATLRQQSGPPLAQSSQTRPQTAAGIKPGIEGAVARASVAFVGELPKGSTLAVISISSKDADTANFAIDELEYELVTSKQFTMVDRKTLDAIRTEQHFQISGEVSDQSAVSIGNMLGASIVITGTITGVGNTQRLTLKALNVKTAQIIMMAREAF